MMDNVNEIPDLSTAVVCTTEHLGMPIFLNRRASTTGPAYAEHGALVDHHGPQENAIPASPELAWSRIRKFLRDPLSEFFGVFILILFGDGVVAQVVLSADKNGDYQSITWGKFFFYSSGFTTTVAKYFSFATYRLGYRCHARCLHRRYKRCPPQPRRHIRKLRLPKISLEEIPRLHCSSNPRVRHFPSNTQRNTI